MKICTFSCQGHRSLSPLGGLTDLCALPFPQAGNGSKILPASRAPQGTSPNFPPASPCPKPGWSVRDMEHFPLLLGPAKQQRDREPWGGFTFIQVKGATLAGAHLIRESSVLQAVPGLGHPDRCDTDCCVTAPSWGGDSWEWH